MDPVEYYIKTLTVAFKNIAPLVAFVIGGYFIFVKMPFLLFRKSMNEQKKKVEEENKGLEKVEKYTVEDYKKFQDTMKLLSGQKEIPKQENPKQDQKKQEQKKKEEKKEERKEERRERPAAKPAAATNRSPEEVFNLKPGESLSGSELKKRYFELLKQNHPDRVASMGQDFKKLAENNTKEINKAFEALKKKAS